MVFPREGEVFRGLHPFFRVSVTRWRCFRTTCGRQQPDLFGANRVHALGVSQWRERRLSGWGDRLLFPPQGGLAGDAQDRHGLGASAWP